MGYRTLVGILAVITIVTAIHVTTDLEWAVLKRLYSKRTIIYRVVEEAGQFASRKGRQKVDYAQLKADLSRIQERRGYKLNNLHRWSRSLPSNSGECY